MFLTLNFDSKFGDICCNLQTVGNIVLNMNTRGQRMEKEFHLRVVDMF